MGTDHAGIATQMLVERQLEQEGTNRNDLSEMNSFQRYGNGKKNLVSSDQIHEWGLKQIGLLTDLRWTGYARLSKPHSSDYMTRV